MKKKESNSGAKKQAEAVAVSIATKTATPATNKKSKKVDEISTPALKIKKPKTEENKKGIAGPKVQKSPKEDKPTKFLVSMKKSVRKGIKKEAAEAGISMNEYIVVALLEKMGLTVGGAGAK